MHRRAAVEAWLRDGAERPTASVLAREGLAAWAGARIREDAPEAAVLRDATRRATLRHLHVTASVRELIRAWRSAGIDVMVFKGFHLATFVHERCSDRPYNDVDVAVRPDEVDRARDVALAEGWRLAWESRTSLYDHNHEALLLVREGIDVEVHRWLLDVQRRDHGVHVRLTNDVWDASEEVEWQGTTLRVPTLVDGLLVGLLLARAWSGGDDWHLKATDWLDLTAARDVGGLDRRDLTERARELHIERTVELVLRRLDPWKGRLELRRPTRSERWAWTFAVISERGHTGWERFVARLERTPGTLWDAARVLPHVAGVAFDLRRRGDVSAHLSVAPGRSGPLEALGGPPSFAEKERTVRGVKLAARCVRPFGDPCRVRTAAIARLLAQQGWSTTVVETIDASGLRHARLESDVSLRDLDDADACPHGRVVARHRVASCRTSSPAHREERRVS